MNKWDKMQEIIDEVLTHRQLIYKINDAFLIDSIGYILDPFIIKHYAVIPYKKYKYIDLLVLTDENYIEININNERINSRILPLNCLIGIEETIYLTDQDINIYLLFSPNERAHFYYPIEDKKVKIFVGQLRRHQLKKCLTIYPL
jgi:hypothetical protein